MSAAPEAGGSDGRWQAARPAGEQPVLVAGVGARGFDVADVELEAPC